MKFLLPLYIIFFTSLLILSCASNNKESSGYEIKNGLIYKTGSSLPFTGTEKVIVQNKTMEYEVVNGKKQGSFKISGANGNPVMIGTIVNNKNEGLWRYYYADGKIESEGYFKDDKPDGKWQWFYENGRLKEEGYYTGGTSCGEWKQFGQNGKLISNKMYEAGKEVIKKSLD